MRRATEVVGGWLGGAAAAVGFLTVLPVPEALATGGRGSATVFFPWLGLLLGFATAAVVRLPGDPYLGALLALSLLFFVTGGLHWDGWADTLDAVVPPGLSVDKRIAILGDPRLGAHGAVGVGLLLLLAAWGLARAPVHGIVLGSMLGRWMMVATLRWAPPLRSEGSGASMRGQARPLWGGVGVLAVTGAAISLGGAGAEVGLAMVGGLAFAALSTMVLVRRLGGLNGDGHGAVGLLTEVGVWVMSAELAGLTW